VKGSLELSNTTVGLAITIYIRCVYGFFGRQITKCTVKYGVYIWFWPTLHNSDQHVTITCGLFSGSCCHLKCSSRSLLLMSCFSIKNSLSRKVQPCHWSGRLAQVSSLPRKVQPCHWSGRHAVIKELNLTAVALIALWFRFGSVESMSRGKVTMTEFPARDKARTTQWLKDWNVCSNCKEICNRWHGASRVPNRLDLDGNKDQGSRIKDQGSRIKDQGSRIKDQGSRIKDQG
jgi:hypothetical protein